MVTGVSIAWASFMSVHAAPTAAYLLDRLEDSFGPPRLEEVFDVVHRHARAVGLVGPEEEQHGPRGEERDQPAVAQPGLEGDEPRLPQRPRLAVGEVELDALGAEREREERQRCDEEAEAARLEQLPQQQPSLINGDGPSRRLR